MPVTVHPAPANGTYVSVVDASVGDGVTDATTAIQAKIDEVIAVGGGTVFFPSGTYLCDVEGGTIGAGISYALKIDGSNVRLSFDEGAVLKSTARSVLAIGGALKPGGVFGDYYLGDPTNATYYEIDPAERGAQSLVTATPADAGNFAAGDWLHIRTGSLNTGTVTEPDAELNQVTSSDDSTGKIVLRWPLTKAYAQEYFIAGTDGKTSTSVTANPATFGVANITDRTIENVSIEGLRLDTAGTSRSAIVVRGGLVGFDVAGVTGTIGGSLFDAIEYRQSTVRDVDVHMAAADSGTHRWIVTTATTVSDVLFENINGRGTGDRQLIGHFHEGSANVTVRGLRLTSEAGQDDGNPLSVRARAYNHLYEDIDIVSGGTQSAYVDDTCTGGVTLVRPRVVIDGDPTKGLRVSAAGARVIDPYSDTVLTDEVNAAQFERINLTAGDFEIISGTPALEVIASRWRGWRMDAATAESVAAAVKVPPWWQTFHIDLYWTNQGAGVGDVRWLVNLDRAGDGESIGASAGGGAPIVTATAPAANVLEVTRVAASLAVDPSKLLNVRVVRNAAEVVDTLTNDAVLLAVVLTRAS